MALEAILINRKTSTNVSARQFLTLVSLHDLMKNKLLRRLPVKDKISPYRNHNETESQYCTLKKCIQMRCKDIIYVENLLG